MATIPAGEFLDDSAPVDVSPEKSLKGFRREELRVDEKQFVAKDPDVQQSE